MKRTDQLFSFLTKITLLKIDVKGAEYVVLNYFGELFNKVKFMNIENDEKLFSAFGVSFNEICNLLTNNNFLIFKREKNYLLQLSSDYKSNEGEDIFAFKEIDKKEFMSRSGFTCLN